MQFVSIPLFPLLWTPEKSLSSWVHLNEILFSLLFFRLKKQLFQLLVCQSSSPLMVLVSLAAEFAPVCLCLLSWSPKLCTSLNRDEYVLPSMCSPCIQLGFSALRAHCCLMLSSQMPVRLDKYNLVLVNPW